MIVPETFRQGDIIAYVLVNTSFLYAEVHRKGMRLHAARGRRWVDLSI